MCMIKHVQLISINFMSPYHHTWSQNSDQMILIHHTCPEGKWKCDNNICIDQTRVCDGSGLYGCTDGSDEAHCKDYVCPESMWKCHDGITCLDRRKICNGKSDCPHSSDESPSVCLNWTCPPRGWKCHLYDEWESLDHCYEIMCADTVT